MPHVIVFSPILDIALLVLVSNIISYGVYARLYGRNFKQIAAIDLRLSIAELLVLIANYAYSGVVITVASREISWFWWYVIISVPVEIGSFLLYKWYTKASLAEMINGR